jgi:hypothetical protein
MHVEFVDRLRTLYRTEECYGTSQYTWSVAEVSDSNAASKHEKYQVISRIRMRYLLKT